MKLIAVKMVVAVLILNPTPASAVPQWVEDLCWYHANVKVTIRDRYHHRGAARIQSASAIDWLADVTLPAPSQRLAQHVFQSPRFDRVQRPTALCTAQPKNCIRVLPALLPKSHFFGPFPGPSA